MKMTRMTLAVMATLASGCGAGTLVDGNGEALVASDATLVAAQGVDVDNGRELNGRELNGRELNGRELNGRELNGRELNGRELNGSRLGGALGEVSLSELWLEGSELVARAGDGSVVRGAALVGARLGSEGTPVRYRIDAVASAGDVWSYQVSYFNIWRWSPLCDDGASSIPLEGRWDYRRAVEGGGSHVPTPGVLTFACEDAALGKCVNMGYAPWRTDAQGGSLAAHHQACTRMLRADYCGDGRSFTKDGFTINIYDGVGVQADTEGWTLEAEWNEQGAVCLDGRRLNGSSHVPRCSRDLALSTCGDKAHFSSGTLLMTEYQER